MVALADTVSQATTEGSMAGHRALFALSLCITAQAVPRKIAPTGREGITATV